MARAIWLEFTQNLAVCIKQPASRAVYCQNGEVGIRIAEQETEDVRMNGDGSTHSVCGVGDGVCVEQQLSGRGAAVERREVQGRLAALTRSL